MEVSYHREMKKNYLMIEADEEGMQAFEAKMLVGNAIEGLLKFRIRRTDDHCQFCYEITSRQPLGRFLETKSINAVQIRSLLLGIAQTLIRMEDYLLSEHQILLDPDYIYIDPESFQPGLCLLPGKKGSFPDEFSEFLQFLLGKADHQDKDAVVLIYGLYRESLKENYGLDNLLRWLMRDEGKVGEAPDEKEKDPLRSPLDRNDSSWEPDSTMDVFREEKSLETEKRPRTNEKLSASKTTNKGNTWGIKTVVLKIVECLLLIPLFFAGVWLWKGDAALSYLTGEGIWVAAGAVTVVVVGCILAIRRGIAARKTKNFEEISQSQERTGKPTERVRQAGNPSMENRETDYWHGKRDGTKCLVEKQQEKPSWEMIFAEEDGERETPEHVTGSYAESAYKSGVNDKYELGKNQNESDDCHTVLLWDRNKKENVRRLACLNRPELTAQMSYYPFLIGKQENLADFAIPDGTISRLHIRIDQKDGGYTLTDLNSTNGTTVNNRKLEANETVTLQVGDLVDIAGYHFQFL